MNGLQSLPAWQSYFNYPTKGKLGLLNAIQVRRFLSAFLSSATNVFMHQSIGGLAALPVVPYLSDGIGRRPTVFIGACIMCIAAVIQTASQSVGMFIGARFVDAMGFFSRLSS
jgi:MFS family permease